MVCFQCKPFNITSIHFSTNSTNNAEEDEIEWFYEGQQELLKLPPKRDVLFIVGGWKQK